MVIVLTIINLVLVLALGFILLFAIITQKDINMIQKGMIGENFKLILSLKTKPKRGRPEGSKNKKK